MRGWAASGWLIAGLIAVTPLSRAADPAAEEAKLLARRLAEENARLRETVAALEAERDRLLARLAEGEMRADRWTLATAPLPSAEPGGGDVAPDGWPVVDASRELGLVALRGGVRDGLRPGLAVAIVRDGVVIARARVVEVRERIAGARVETQERGSFPEQGDRAVVWRMKRE
ncbi:MAG: hypothetical protein NZ740_00180 [Kiritimatiellae bacterium]|nr:hypothetical protein [Kiritimatiellia bacterium]MDW8457507.1 hypothetical protein [Verrucomicrobiota bacterium]